MDLADILGREQIVPELKATNRWEAIDELIGNLVATGKIQAGDRDAVTAAVKKRETSMSTGIGFGIGIPHASTDLIYEVVGALGRSPRASISTRSTTSRSSSSCSSSCRRANFRNISTRSPTSPSSCTRPISAKPSKRPRRRRHARRHPRTREKVLAVVAGGASVRREIFSRRAVSQNPCSSVSIRG
jgi:hypothetical protein